MIIGMNGFGYAGKDTAYRYLKQLLKPWPVHREGFADRLKVSAAAAVGIPVETLESLKDCGRITFERRVEDPYGQGADASYEFVQSMGVRRYLERYGTEAHRDVFDQDFWIGVVMESHVGHLMDNPTAVTVVTDLRFPNEAEAILEHHGEVWEVIRPGKALDSDHPSNQPLPRHLVTRTIMNDSDLEGYRFNLAIAVRDAFGKAVS